MKKYLFIFIFFILSRPGLTLTVLIDPGHGGDDTGAKSLLSKSGQQILEKDLAMQISKKLYYKLKPFHSVYLTRSIDRNVSLQERSDLAEKIKADIFVSIHLNSSTQKDSRGVEVYYLDNHNDVAVKKVETLENQVQGGQDQQIKHVLIDLVIGQTVEQSKMLAKYIHQNIKKKMTIKHRLKDRGVRPGLFYVLALSKRPGVLIEAGFMSNPDEIIKINRGDFQEEMANSILEGILQFSKEKKKTKVSLF